MLVTTAMGLHVSRTMSVLLRLTTVMTKPLVLILSVHLFALAIMDTAAMEL